MQTDKKMFHPIGKEFYEKCAYITEEYEKIRDRWSLTSQLNHMHDEISELSDALRNKDEKWGQFGSPQFYEHIYEESADIGLTWIATNNFLGINHKTLNLALNNKLSVLSNRVEEIKKERGYIY